MDETSKSRRPANTAFKQQRLKAWQPILTPRTVLPLFFIVGIIFTPIGSLLLLASNRVQEIVIDYTDCQNQADWSNIPADKISYAFNGASPPTPFRWRSDRNASNTAWQQQICTLEFSLPNDFTPPVFYYYRLTNFYQNHRRYVKSVDENQLKGQPLTLSQLDSAGGCTPLVGNGTVPYYPCGLIANSLFNDSIYSPVLLNPSGSSASNETYNMTDKGIAWSTDTSRFQPTQYTPSQVIPPPYWARMFPNGYSNGLPNLQNWEALQVWMRTAGLPTFSKLALRNDTSSMRAGTYQARITDNFPVTGYGGTKSMVITTRTVIGGRNPFLGIAYIVVGALCIVLGTIFLGRHLIKPRKLGDHAYLSWNNAETRN